MARNAMRQIVLVTINDQADFGKQVGQEAFADRLAADQWAVAECEEIKARSDDPDYCSPVASFDSVWFTDTPE